MKLDSLGFADRSEWHSKAAGEDHSLEEVSVGLPPVEEGDRKVTLIMELSSLISLHMDRIGQLEDILEEKDRKIQQLEAEREPPASGDLQDPPEC
ncbi:coiled-coil domain-containing protein 192-like [Lepus europaeus]|uniref:coiled-coil domain-containing protein 192-like n=1 Tax=Lepus europaeus TaxID=9983 RepID=UPI002B4A1BB5|nr:coiled-coil domain-containing protein 192-like [Lepus europaeus]